jgi:hypothetical protein
MLETSRRENNIKDAESSSRFSKSTSGKDLLLVV